MRSVKVDVAILSNGSALDIRDTFEISLSVVHPRDDVSDFLL